MILDTQNFWPSILIKASKCDALINLNQTSFSDFANINNCLIYKIYDLRFESYTWTNIFIFSEWNSPSLF